jgi:integrase
VDRSAQERQTVSQVQLQTILANAPERYSILLALIAGTGLRVGEAAGLHHSDFQNQCGVLYVLGSVWHVKPQLLRPRMPCASSIHHIARIFPISKFAAAHRLCPMRAPFLFVISEANRPGRFVLKEGHSCEISHYNTVACEHSCIIPFSWDLEYFLSETMLIRVGNTILLIRGSASPRLDHR